MSATKAPGKKSGIRTLAPGEVLFHENDSAESLYIIQRGQLRLYRPKGRGFVDLAILRTGEVIGEMAYFDEKNRRRSCSAAAITSTDIIEISFNAFSKTMANLNPWFKTIINTLATRLRKTNERVKELESNSVGFGAGGKVADYVFFHTSDILKMMSLFYLIVKNHGDQNEGKYFIHKNKLKFYILDIFAIHEVKYEEFLNILKNLKIIEVGMDEDGLPKLLSLANPDQFRAMTVFFNTQRLVDDAKKVQISDKCETFLGAILSQIKANGIKHPQEVSDISAILKAFEQQNIPVVDEDLKDAVKAGLCEDIIVGEGNKLTSVVNIDKLDKMFPALRMMNAIKKINETKAKDGRGGY